MLSRVALGVYDIGIAWRYILMLRLHLGVVLACNCVHGAPSHVYWFTVSWTRIWITLGTFLTGISALECLVSFMYMRVIYVCTYEYEERLGRAFE